MLFNPIQDALVAERSVRHAETESNQVSIRILHGYAVYIQEDEQRIDTNPFVPVDKSVILCQRITQLCRLFFMTGIKFLPIKSYQWAFARLNQAELHREDRQGRLFPVSETDEVVRFCSMLVQSFCQLLKGCPMIFKNACGRNANQFILRQ